MGDPLARRRGILDAAVSAVLGKGVDLTGSATLHLSLDLLATGSATLHLSLDLLAVQMDPQLK